MRQSRYVTAPGGGCRHTHIECRSTAPSANQAPDHNRKEWATFAGDREQPRSEKIEGRDGLGSSVNQHRPGTSSMDEGLAENQGKDG